MADNKTYYYMRLKENFFDDDMLKVIEGIPNEGYKYSNILLKLYLRSLKYDGRLMLNNTIPYSTNMVSSITGHDESTCKCALDLFQQLGLIEILDNGAMYMLNIQNFIGKSSTEADRKREYDRQIAEEKRLLIQINGEMSEKSPRNVGEMSEISLPEIEIEKEIDINNTLSKDNVRSTPKELQRVMDAWNELGLSKVTRIVKGTDRYTWVKKRIKDYGIDEVLRAISNVKESEFLQNATFFSFDWMMRPNNFPKVLEGNYMNDKTKKDKSDIDVQISKEERQ